MSGSPIPEDKVKTFLSMPFLRRGRKALVVRVGPRTLVEKEVLKSARRAAVSGLSTDSVVNQINQGKALENFDAYN